MEGGRFPEAIDDFSEAIGLNPEDSRIYALRGGLHFKLNQFDRSIEDFSEVVRLSPEDSMGQYALLGARFALRQFESIIESTSEIIRQNPKDSETHLFLGVAHAKMKEFDRAIEHFSDAIQLNSLDSQGYYYRGAAYLETKRINNAIEDCSEAIRLNPKFSEAHYCLGSAHAKGNQFNKAIKNFSEAIRLNHEYSEAYLARGIAKFNSDMPKEARADIDDVLRIGSFESKLYVEVGNFYETSEGRKAIEKVICCLRIAERLEKFEHELPLLRFRLGSYYSAWEERKGLGEDFLSLLGEHRGDCEKYWIDELTFEQRIDIARNFYALSFKALLSRLRTDVRKSGYINKDEKESRIKNHELFEGEIKTCLYMAYNEKHEDFLFFPIEKEALHFDNVKNFKDKTDCPILLKENISTMIAQIAFEHVRVRCLSFDNGKINHAMWEKFSSTNGVMYQLTIKKEWLLHHSILAKKINYYNKEERRIELNSCISPEDVIESGMCVKFDQFEYQKELRLFKFGDYANMTEKEDVPFDCNGKAGVEITAVYLGCEIAPEHKEKMKGLVKKHNGTMLYQMEYDSITSDMVANEILIVK